MVSLWRYGIPALALRHDFLLSSILAITSLHLALLNPCALHTSAAIGHHSQALALTRPHLLNLSPDNASALFPFSCLIALYSFGVHSTSASTFNPIVEMIEVFTLIRGIGAIVKSGAQWLEPDLHAESMLPSPSNPNASLAPKIEATLAVLSRCNSESTTDMTIRDAYGTTIWMLRQVFLLAAENPGAKMTVLPFPIMVPRQFMEKLEDRDPMALVILAHYSVVLYWLRNHIWLRGWGRQLVDAIHLELGSEWHGCLKWAIEEVRSPEVDE